MSRPLRGIQKMLILATLQKAAMRNAVALTELRDLISLNVILTYRTRIYLNIWVCAMYLNLG